MVPVAREDVGLWRGKLDWHFKSFCRAGDFSSDELWGDVESGKRALFVIWDGSVLGAFLTMISGATVSKLTVTHAAGKDRHKWLPLWPVVEAYAREAGCEILELYARFGWEPDLKGVGLRKTHIVMEKRL